MLEVQETQDVNDQECNPVEEPLEDGVEELSDESLEHVSGGWTQGGGNNGNGGNGEGDGGG